MLRSNTTTDKYKLNASTTMTVKNTPTTGAEGEAIYQIDITLKHKTVRKQSLAFDSADDAADFFGNIDYAEEQQSLL